MTWGKVSDRLHSHSKARRAREAMALWVLALSWSCDELTDGFVPSDMPEILMPGLGVAMATKLVEVRLWEESEGGYRFHDWGQFQPSAEDERERRAAISRMRSELGKRGAMARWQNDKVDSKPMANAMANPSQTLWQTDGPDPDPEPERRRETSKSRVTDAVTVNADSESGADAPASASAGAVVRSVFEHWQRVHNHPTSKLDPKRRRAIERALKSHGEETVRAAIEGCARSEWHKGKNDRGLVYDDLTLILRDASKIEGFAALAAPAPRQPQIHPPVVSAAHVAANNPFLRRRKAGGES